MELCFLSQHNSSLPLIRSTIIIDINQYLKHWKVLVTMDFFTSSQNNAAGTVYEGEEMEQTVKHNKAEYHKVCRNKYDTYKLQRQLSKIDNRDILHIRNTYEIII
ncbi:hypothetical protein AVEN_262391-1 [Araneus ventricosus]|uniref:Uncharacterized protein n=1 Tax=Araneus ventricosus TaxID=182803 RepID=A0A4Y2IJG3_ARAVE|nr:hypothetical protein AVEN_262391-1 [Araneus ventricosus]